MKPTRIFVYQESGEEPSAFPLAWYAQFGLQTEEEVSAVYEGYGNWHQFILKPRSGQTNRDINRLARVEDEKFGFVLDSAELPAARAEAMVESWDLLTKEGLPAPISKAGYYALPGAVSDILDGVLAVAANGGGIDSRFLAYLNSKPLPVEEKSQETTDSPTSLSG